MSLFTDALVLPRLTNPEKFCTLIVEPDRLQRASLRRSLTSLSFGQVFDAPDHLSALDKLIDHEFSHVIFDVNSVKIPIKQFLSRIMEYNPNMIPVATSGEASVDDVFDLLLSGARGFLLKPFTTASVESAFVLATKAEPLPDEMRYAKDRNEALCALVMSSFYKLTTLLKQAKQFETAKREIPRATVAFRQAVELSKTFAKGGEFGLLYSMVDFCIDRSNGPDTRIGKFRQIAKDDRDKRGSASEKKATRRQVDKALNVSELEVLDKDTVTIIS